MISQHRGQAAAAAQAHMTHPPARTRTMKKKERTANSRDVQKAILVLVFLVDAAHERRRRGQHLIHEDEDGLLRAQLDALADDVDELSDRQVGRHQVLLLVDGGDVGFFHFFADHLFLGGAPPVSKWCESIREGC